MIPVRARRDWVLSSPHARGLIGLWVPTPGGFADIVQANHAHARAGAPLQAIDKQRRRAWRFASGQYFTAGSSTPQLTGNLVGVGDGFSWAAWVKFSSGGGAYQMVMTRAAGSGAAWEIARDLSGGTAAQLYFSASGTHTAATTAVSLEEWHLWHLSAEGWFVDGRLNTGSASATPITAGGAIQFNARANSLTGTHAIGRVFMWNRKQSAAEIASFYRSEIGNTERRIWVPVSAGGGGGSTISVPSGALALTGFAPTVSATANQIIAVPAGALTLAGFAPTVNVGANQAISVPAGSLTMTGFAPTVNVGVNQNIAVPAGSLSLTGFAPTISTSANQTIAVPVGSLTLTGFAPTVVQTAHQTISVPLGTLVMAGYAPTVSASGSYTISVPLGALVLTGYAPVVNNSGATVTVTVKLGSWIRYKILT